MRSLRNFRCINTYKPNIISHHYNNCLSEKSTLSAFDRISLQFYSSFITSLKAVFLLVLVYGYQFHFNLYRRLYYVKRKLYNGHQSSDPVPGLNGRRFDFIWRRHEAIKSSISQLDDVRVDDTFLNVIVVGSDSRSDIYYQKCNHEPLIAHLIRIVLQSVVEDGP